MLRGLAVWLLIMLVETIHGILRGLFIVPHVGEAAANRIGWPIGMIIVLIVSYLSIRFTKLRTTGSLLALGVIWAVLTFFFEIGIGLLRGLDAQEIAAAINPMLGGLMLYSLAVMFAAPLVAHKLQRLRGR